MMLLTGRPWTYRGFADVGCSGLDRAGQVRLAGE